MLAKLVEWVQSKVDYKNLLIVVGLLLLLVGVATGVVWFLLAGGVSFMPKVIEELGEINGNREKEEKKIDAETKKRKKRLAEEERAAKEREAEEERRREAENQRSPQKKSAKELEDDVLEGIDNAGK